MADYQPVVQARDLGPGELVSVEVHGRNVVVANVGQTYYALDARCPDEGTDLGEHGELRGYLLICPADESAYDVRTGERSLPGEGPRLRRYSIKVEENAVMVGPPAAPEAAEPAGD